jgi:UDP-glucose 4-epimerase
VRDNIHVSLLAAAYCKFSAVIATKHGGATKLNPSGYVETQGAFSQRYAGEMQKRLGTACAVDLSSQVNFSEPMMRVNMDAAQRYVNDWDEVQAWDDVARAFAETL